MTVRARLGGRKSPVAGIALAVWIGSAATLSAQSVAMDTASLADGPYASMHALLERTIFQVDVLTLDVRFGPDGADRLRELAAERERDDELADSIAGVAMRAQDAYAAIEFQRGVRLDQFLDGIRENMGKARDAGILSATSFEEISEGLGRWFDFLEERGLLKGDRLLYRIRGDTLRTVYVAADGQVLLDQTDVGRDRRLAVLGSYFVEGSDFRERLIESLFE